MRRNSPIAHAALALTLAAFATSPVNAQESLADRFSFHGSLNAGVGIADNLPVFGITKDGTSNYRAVALQFGYKLGDNSRIVTQLLSRELGASPLQAAEKDVFPVWAFYEHKFSNGITAKVGRNPLPRGIFNEVRFVGTLIPFYRVGAAVYGETLEYVDGAVVSKTFDLGSDFKVDANVFGGGSDIKAIVPSTTGGSSIYRARLEQLAGTQLWLSTPIKGVKLGQFLGTYLTTPSASLPEASRPGRSTTILSSFNGTWTKAFARGEYEEFRTSKTKSKYVAYYVQGGINPTEQFTLAAEYSSTTNRINLPSPFKTFDLNLGTDAALGVTWRAGPQVAFKLEGHRAEGYQFDVVVPTVLTTRTPPFEAKGAPRQKSYYSIASVAVSF